MYSMSQWPDIVLSPAARPLIVLAHPDDEIACGGLAQRLPASTRFMWVTDGDGLAEGAEMRRSEYASARRLESEAAMATLGVSPDRLRFLGNSEVAIFDALARCASRPDARHDVFEHARTMARQVAAEVLSMRPDVVFTVAWQGAHPVHDLVHLLVRRAIEDLPRTLLFEMPLFDPWAIIPLRFPRWHTGTVHEVRLTPAETDAKRRMAACWPSQDVVLEPLRTVIAVAGGLLGIAGRGFNLDTLLAVEHFAPVPRDRDYLRSPHGLGLLDNPLERYKGVRISHASSLAPIVQALSA
jgi:LmbE family N-acetylglucosaminyl deacetylase